MMWDTRHQFGRDTLFEKGDDDDDDEDDDGNDNDYGEDDGSTNQRQKNLGSRVALLPGKFLRVRKVFARITEKIF